LLFFKEWKTTKVKMSIMTFILCVVYASWSWRIMESYYYNQPCNPCDLFELNENFDLETLLYWND
jgi:hypothetical protein